LDIGEAESAKEYLEFQGILAIVETGDAASAGGAPPDKPGMLVTVREDDHDQAFGYLEEAGFFTDEERE
jgi:hypothetical protein